MTDHEATSRIRRSADDLGQPFKSSILLNLWLRRRLRLWPYR